MTTPIANIHILKQALETSAPKDAADELHRLFRLRLLLECQLRGVDEIPEDGPMGVRFSHPRQSDWLLLPHRDLEENPEVIEELKKLENTGWLALVEEDDNLLVYVFNEDWIAGPENSRPTQEHNEQAMPKSLIITLTVE